MFPKGTLEQSLLQVPLIRTIPLTHRTYWHAAKPTWEMLERVSLELTLGTEELLLLNCGAKEDSWESLGLVRPVNPKGNQLWIFIGGTDAEAEAPILDEKHRLIGKDPDAGKDWRQKKKGVKEDEMVGWHHWLNGHEFEQTPGDGEGQRSLACYSPWGRKDSNTTYRLNNRHLGILSVWFQTKATKQLLQQSKLCEVFGFLVCIKFMFISRCHLLNMQ